MRLIILSIVLISVCFSLYFFIRNRKEKANMKNDEDVVEILSNENSELFKFVVDQAYKSVDDALANGGHEYSFFRDNIIEYTISALDKHVDEHGVKWLDIDNEFTITKENLEMAVRSIMDIPEMYGEVAKLYLDKVLSNMKEAENHEIDAIEYNKEFGPDSEDDELHPRIPNPGENRDDDIDEISIDSLMSVGTAEDIGS